MRTLIRGASVVTMDALGDLPPLLAALNRSGRKITSALGLAH